MSNLGKGVILALCMIGAGCIGYSIAMQACKDDNEVYYNLGKIAGYSECIGKCSKVAGDNEGET